MKPNKITDAINYIDMDLIMEADIPAPARTLSLSARLRITLAAACALLSCMLFVAVPLLRIENLPEELPLVPPTSDSVITDTAPTKKPQTDTPNVTPTPNTPPLP